MAGIYAHNGHVVGCQWSVLPIMFQVHLCKKKINNLPILAINSILKHFCFFYICQFHEITKNIIYSSSTH